MIDEAAVAAWMTEQGLGEGPLQNLSDVPGGTQNVMVRFERDGRRLILRRGPRHLRPRSNKSILREARVLSALAGTDVPHPRVVAACDDTSVLGDAVFFLMEPIEGFNPGVELPSPHADDPGLRHQMGLEVADALASLGTVDHEAAGLADFGRPDGFLERQVPRWLSDLASYSELEGYPGAAIPGVEAVGAWLEERVPTRFQPGIMHGDYHCANVLFSRTGPGVEAIVDWEMATIGDPLLDLGWLLATWRLPEVAGFGGELMASSGLADRGELIERYGARSARDLAAIDWYTVLACFKLGIVLEGTHARAYAGKAPIEVGEVLHAITLRLFERAHELMEGTE